MHFKRQGPHLRRFLFTLAALLGFGLMACAKLSAASTQIEPKPSATLRVATFNMAMGLAEGELDNRLNTKNDNGLKKAAAIIQTVRPDVLLLNEFDAQGADSIPSSRMQRFQDHYLSIAQFGQEAIEYGYHYTADVNTGLASGVDLNGNGKLDEPADAHGFGLFHGQYSMLVLSRYPIAIDQVRSWQKLRWQDYPDAHWPHTEDGEHWYSVEARASLRLSSKSHWDIPIQWNGEVLHFITTHPTPPVFDGPEDRNGLRNYDEIGLLAMIIDPQRNQLLQDDQGERGGLQPGDFFVIAGDMNADPMDGNSTMHAMDQLLNHSLINASHVPTSKGAVVANQVQGGANRQHKGQAAADTADFNDERGPGNLRIDYVLPSRQLKIKDSGVFWPEPGTLGSDWIDVSDHRLVWIDVQTL